MLLAVNSVVCFCCFFVVGFGGGVGFFCGGVDFCDAAAGAAVCIVLVFEDLFCDFVSVSSVGLGKLLPLGHVISVCVAVDTFAVFTTPA